MFIGSGLLSLLLLCPHLASAIKDGPAGARTAGDDNTSSHISAVRGDSREWGFFPPWYYRKANAMLDCRHEPQTHMYLMDRQSILGGLDKFFKGLNVSYSLWRGSLIAVARASKAGVDAMSMPWDLDIDIVLTEAGWKTVAALVPNLRERDPTKMNAMEQTMKDLDSGITLMNDGMVRVMMSNFAHGDLKHKWLEKALHTANWNLGKFMPPGAYADVYADNHISTNQLLVDCKLDGITSRCPAEVLDATRRGGWMKSHVADDWSEPDHYWDAKRCAFVCKTCNDENGHDSPLLKELRDEDVISSHKWGMGYQQGPIGAVQSWTSLVRREQALSAA